MFYYSSMEDRNYISVETKHFESRRGLSLVVFKKLCSKHTVDPELYLLIVDRSEATLN